MTSRAAAEPMKNCRYSQFSRNAVAGTEMMVTALTSVATKDKHAAHHGTLRLPRKNSRVLVCRFSNQAPTTSMDAKKQPTTTRSGHVKSDRLERNSDNGRS